MSGFQQLTLPSHCTVGSCVGLLCNGVHRTDWWRSKYKRRHDLFHLCARLQKDRLLAYPIWCTISFQLFGSWRMGLLNRFLKRSRVHQSIAAVQCDTGAWRKWCLHCDVVSSGGNCKKPSSMHFRWLRYNSWSMTVDRSGLKEVSMVIWKILTTENFFLK